MRARGPIAAVLVLAAACGGADRSAPRAPAPIAAEPPSPACARARELRARAPRLLEEGRLDRAIRVMQRAEDGCREEAEATWAARVAALAAIGRVAEARQLAGRIDRSDRATAGDKRAAAAARAACDEHEGPLNGEGANGPERYRDPTMQGKAAAIFRRGRDAAIALDHARAKALFLEAWTAWHPFPRALIEAGLAAAALGDRPGAQRLWDRAAFDDPTAPIAAELPNGAPTGLYASLLAWSPRGSRLALAADGKIAIFDAALRRRFQIDAGAEVLALAFSAADGDLFAGLADGAVRVWDLVAGELLGDLAGHTGAVRALALSPDRRALATASDDGTVRLWDTRKGSALRILPLRTAPASALAWSPDGGLLAWSTEAGKISVWDARTGLAVGDADARRGPVRALAFSLDGRSLSAVTGGARLRFDLDRLKSAPAIVDRSAIDRCAIDVRAEPAHEVLAAARAGAIVITDLATGEALSSRPIDPPGALHALAVSPDGKSVAAAFGGRVLRVYPVASGAELASIAPTSPLEAIAALAAGKAFVASDDFGRALHWSADGLRVLGGEPGSPRARAVAISPDGRTIALGSDAGAVRLLDLAAAAPERTLLTGAPVLSIAFSSDGKHLAAGAESPGIRLWDATTGAAAGELRLKAGPVRAVRFSPDGARLLSASRDGVTLWDVAARQGMRHTAYGAEPRDAAFARDGATFAVAGADASLRVGVPGKPAPTHVVPVAPQVLSLDFTEDGSIAAAEGDRSVTLRLPAGKVIHRYRERDAASRAVAAAPGRIIAAAFADGAIRLYRAPVDGAAATLRAAPGALRAGYASGPAGHVDFLGDDAAAARDAAACRIGITLYPFDVCAEQFVVKGLLGIVLAGQDPAEADP